MKCQRVFLAQWLADSVDHTVDIPWPRVHQQATPEKIHWLNQREFTDCQMVLEDDAQGMTQSLWAEFYQPRTYTEYLLKFGSN